MDSREMATEPRSHREKREKAFSPTSFSLWLRGMEAPPSFVHYGHISMNS